METESTSGFITADELSSRMADNRGPVIVDTLPEDHFRRRHINGAINACVFEVVFVKAVRDRVTDPHQPVVVYGYDADTHDARVAAEKLIADGYSNVRMLAGGLVGWADAGHPLVGDHPETRVPHPQPVVADGSYIVDTDASVVGWTGRNPSGKHFGTVGVREGRIRVDHQTATGTFTLDMTAIRNTDLKGDPLYNVLIDHLSSDDFFFVKRYPTAEFVLTEMAPVAGGSLSSPNYHARGRLSMRGVDVALEFRSTVSSGADGSVSAEAHFDIDRTQWGVIYGSSRFFKHLGKHLVYDLISLEVTIVARPQKP